MKDNGKKIGAKVKWENTAVKKKKVLICGAVIVVIAVGIGFLYGTEVKEKRSQRRRFFLQR